MSGRRAAAGGGWARAAREARGARAARAAGRASRAPASRAAPACARASARARGAACAPAAAWTAPIPTPSNRTSPTSRDPAQQHTLPSAHCGFRTTGLTHQVRKKHDTYIFSNSYIQKAVLYSSF